MKAITLALLLASGSAGIMGQTPSGDAMKSINDVIKAHLTWNEKQLNAPGAEIVLKEKAQSPGKVTYAIYVRGLPRDKVFDLVQWPVTLTKPVVALKGVTFGEDGLAICAGRAGTCGDAAKPNDPIDFVASAAPGEPLRFAFIAADNPSLRAVSNTVPNPLQSADKECTLDAVLLSPRAEILLVIGHGFGPNANIRMHSDSEGEIVEDVKKTDSDGSYTTALLPAKKGLTHGTVKVRLSSNECSPQLSIPWAVAPSAGK